MKHPLKKITAEEFSSIPLDSAMVLKKFDISGSKAISPGDEICLTTGDISVVANPTTQNVLNDINNCPDNLMEGERITGWDVSASYTAVTATPEAMASYIGGAKVAGDKVTGKSDLEEKDFTDLWIVGAKVGGGFAAAHLLHCCGTGTTFTFTRNNKGQFACSMRAHTSVKDSDPYAAPVEFYSTNAAARV